MTTPNQSQLLEAGILVVRQGIDPALARDLSTECQELFASEDATRIYNTTAVDSIGTVDHFPLSTAVLDGAGLMALRSVLAYSPNNKYDPSRAGINRQAPFAWQRFHPDDPISVIVHASDCGAFDFSLADYDRNFAYGKDRPDPPDVLTLELNAGDIVVHTRPYVLHRGRNLGADTRYTLVMSGQ
ncbi:MAG: hypothetical protein QG553_606 [Patescibacteria group bacterium]|nr:hypothetical protein [Patescibacteria group bacterium]